MREGAAVDESALRGDGVEAIIRHPINTLHLLASLNANEYAAEMRGQLAEREAA